MTVAPVRGRDDVAIAQVRADADRHRLFTRIQVEEPGQTPRTDELDELLLEAADRPHLAIHVHEFVATEIHA